MSNPAYPAKVRRVNSAAPQPASAPAVDSVVEDFEEVEDFEDIEEPYESFEVAPAGMAGSRARKVALGAAVVLLLSVFGTALWLLTSEPPKPPTSRVVGLNIGNIAPNFSLV